MAEVKSYISSNVEYGDIFDLLVGNLLAYSPTKWGWTDQDFTKIAEEFDVPENRLYYLPPGNYRLINYPPQNIPSGYSIFTSINLYVYSLSRGKCYIATFGNHERYYMELHSATSNEEWMDISNTLANGIGEIEEIVSSNKPPQDTTKLWFDTSQVGTKKIVILKYYDGSDWVGFKIEDSLNPSVYDPRGINTDIFEYTIERISKILGSEYLRYVNHKKNKLPGKHFLPGEKEILNDSFVTPEELETLFTPEGKMETAMKEHIDTSSREITRTKEISEVEKTFEREISNHLSTHINEEKITKWNSKADPGHGHGPGEIIISPDNITNIEDLKFTQEAIDQINESVTAADDLNGLKDPQYVADNKIHNGSVIGIYASEEDAATGKRKVYMYRVVDASKLGTENFMDGLEAVNKTVPDFKEIQGLPNTIEGISPDFATHESFEEALADYEATAEGYYDIFSTKEVADLAATNINVWMTLQVPRGEHTIFDDKTKKPGTSECPGLTYGDVFNLLTKVSYSGTYQYATDKPRRYLDVPITYTGKETFDTIIVKGVRYGKDAEAHTAVINKTAVLSNMPNIPESSGRIFVDSVEFRTVKTMAPAVSSTFSILELNERLLGNRQLTPHYKYLNNGCFGTAYDNDEDNPKWEAHGVGRSFKVDFASTEKDVLMNSIFTANLSGTPEDYKVTVIYDPAVPDGASTYKALRLKVDRAITHNDINKTMRKLYSNVPKINDWEVALHSKALSNVRSIPKVKLTFNKSYSDCAYGNGVYVCIAANSQYFVYSTNGEDWTEVYIGYTSNWRSICFGDGKFIAINAVGAKVAISTDGVTWTTPSAVGEKPNQRCIFYGKDEFVVPVASTTGKLTWLTSTDGITWTKHVDSNTNSYEWTKGMYGRNRYVLIAKNCNYVAYSADGENWTLSVIDPKNRGLNWWDLSYGTTVFVAVGYTPRNKANTANYPFTTDYPEVMTVSGDRLVPNPDFTLENNVITAMAYSEGGVEWVPITSYYNTKGEEVPLENISLVAVEHNKRFKERTHADIKAMGKTYAQLKKYTIRELTYTAEECSKFLALGQYGVALYSADGKTWFEGVGPGQTVDTNIHSICAGEVFVIPAYRETMINTQMNADNTTDIEYNPNAPMTPTSVRDIVPIDDLDNIRYGAIYTMY